MTSCQRKAKCRINPFTPQLASILCNRLYLYNFPYTSQLIHNCHQVLIHNILHKNIHQICDVLCPISNSNSTCKTRHQRRKCYAVNTDVCHDVQTIDQRGCEVQLLINTEVHCRRKKYDIT